MHRSGHSIPTDSMGLSECAVTQVCSRFVVLCCQPLLNLQIISGLDAGITAMFGVEALLKIFAFTFVAYIRVNSNKVGTPSSPYFAFLLCAYTALHAAMHSQCTMLLCNASHMFLSDATNERSPNFRRVILLKRLLWLVKFGIGWQAGRHACSLTSFICIGTHAPVACCISANIQCSPASPPQEHPCNINACQHVRWPTLILPVQLDFAIVVVSVIVLMLDRLLPGVQWLKGLRVLRALKPLR